ncbi:MAG TPA: MBL fold metallo-hydrolase [Phycisphaerales bacterium]|nr:MBL fold metallo-hydrolase [Phycisphaerales bacterium]
MIKLGFYGAAGEVTGSCYVVTTDRAQVMLDFGMHQGEPEAAGHNRRLPNINPAQLNAVVLTHGHLDHCGRLPMLMSGGFHSPIYCTGVTARISEIILRDAASIQSEDCARFNRRLRRPDEPCAEALYTVADVEQVIRHFQAIDYNAPKAIAPGITVELTDAGHILGSSSVKMTINDGPRTVTIVFSGDVGVVGSPILRDPVTPIPADVVLLESTYGDRDHKPLNPTCSELLSILERAQADHARVLIPAFALGRTQDVLYHIAEFKRAGKLAGVPVFVDSPMATSISTIYRKHRELYDTMAREIVADGDSPLAFPGLSYTATVQESKRLNEMKGPIVIIAASGMATGGRILHHLYHGVSRPETHVVIVGFQGRGTLGRQLVDGAREVTIFREQIPVRAKVHTLGGLSAHAGQSGLINWAAPFATRNGQHRAPKFFLTHGEDGPRQALRDKLIERYSFDPAMPRYGEEVTL